MTALAATHALYGWIDGIGLSAPGLPDWLSAREVLQGKQAYVAAPTVLPEPTLLPTAERRRAGRMIKLCMGVGMQAVVHAGVNAASLTTVFTSSGADGHNCHALCEQLADQDRQISPTRFHNSVHNAAAGYWGIAAHSMAPCQVIAAFDASFGAGLLDALAQLACERQPMLLVAYDCEYPQPMHAKRSTPDCAGVALQLSPQRSSASIASIALQPCTQASDVMENPNLEALRGQIPSMRALPLLQRLAQRQNATVVLDYLAPMQLKLELHLC